MQLYADAYADFSGLLLFSVIIAIEFMLLNGLTFFREHQGLITLGAKVGLSSLQHFHITPN